MINQKHFEIHGKTIQKENEELIDNKNTTPFTINDAKRLATSRKFSKIKEMFSKFKEFIKSKSSVLKSKGEDKENYDQSR